MANTALLILNDVSTNFTYYNPPSRNWTTNEDPLWYGGTTTYVGFTNVSTFGSFEVSFEGTSIAFTGNTPKAINSQSINVSIDGSTPYTTYYMDPTPRSYIQWYQSPTLSDGQHIIKVDGVNGANIDYATITVGQNTPLLGKTIIVDNDDPSVNYSGSWIRNTSRFAPGQFRDESIHGLPFRNSTHRSTTPGDTITLKFTGTSAVVYGIFSWGNIGTLEATYTIDGGAPIAGSYIVTETSPRYVKGILENSNFPFISFDSLSAGDHTLAINVTQCLNHAFVFDYITYSPSFSDLASMPRLGFTTSASGSTSTLSSATTSLNASQVPHAQQSAGLNVVIGTVVGVGVGGLLALAFLAFWLRRRRSKKGLVVPFDALPKGQSPTGDPNTSSPAQLEGIGSQAPAHLGFSSIAELKRERNINLPGTNGRLPVISTIRNPGDERPANPTGIDLPTINPSSGVSALNSSSESEAPPTYDSRSDICSRF